MRTEYEIWQAELQGQRTRWGRLGVIPLIGAFVGIGTAGAALLRAFGVVL